MSFLASDEGGGVFFVVCEETTVGVRAECPWAAAAECAMFSRDWLIGEAKRT